jgi:hypothetical protein
VLSTFIVEFWKRKSAEINTRWGYWNFDDDSERDDEVRKEFVGDEFVSPITGSLGFLNKIFAFFY